MNGYHVVAHASSREGVSRLMHLASGSVAKRYNVSNDRVGSMWEHPYHCTVVQGGRHLLNCLRYVDLNMVRAGEVKHPEQWRWCGYDELTGRRQRYRILNLEHLLERLGGWAADDFTGWYAEEMDRRLANERPVREGHWTEALAVGDQGFVDAITKEYGPRWQFETEKTGDGTWHSW